MATSKTAEVAKAEYIKIMGEPLGVVFHALWQDLAWLHHKWEQYVQLFGTKPSRVDLLNSAAPRFFRVIQDALFEDTVLHITRLTDPPKSSGRENLTIQRLPALVQNDDVRKTVSDLVEWTIRETQFCRDWRNRRIAHRDLGLAIEQGAVPLELASLEKIKKGLSAIADVLNAVDSHYRDSTTVFDIGLDRGGAVSLLYVLDDGIKAEAERRNRIRSGQIRDEDCKSRDL
ncbi:MAG: hypothetical protein HYW28_11125 [Rhodospirillales bacterium]|nr:hypothetical protein [Rhodospirillales bacterium]